MTAKTTILGSIVATMMLTTAATAAPVESVGAGLGKSATQTSRADQPTQRYCIVHDVSGSRIARRTCDTLSSWQNQGIDPRLLPRRR